MYKRCFFEIVGSFNFKKSIMSKTLVITYTARQGSNTKKLADHFIKINEGKTEITIVDLAETPPDLLLKENLNPLVARNFGGVTLDAESAKLLVNNDELTQKVIEVDFIVLATPMYNFSIPGIVKAWFDAIIQKGKTFGFTAEGKMEGLLKGTKALSLMTSGSDFAIEPLKAMDFALPLINTSFGFMGVETTNIHAYGTQVYADTYEDVLAAHFKKIEALSAEWYS